MKFGKDLEQYKSAGWQDDYIDYKGLKVILKKLEEEGADREEVDAEFFQSLEDELEKVNKAFLERCAEVEAALEVATRRMSRSSSSAGLAKEAEAGVSELTLEQKRQSLEERLEAQKQSERIYFDAYRTLGRLQTFVWINTKGFQKIMKKYDKRLELRGTGQELGPDFEKRLEKEAFCSGKLEVLLHLFKSRKPEGVSLSTATKRDGGGAARPHLQLLAGNANPELAEEISARLGVPLTPAKISRFADGEVSIQILENVCAAQLGAQLLAQFRAIRRNYSRNSLTAHPHRLHLQVRNSDVYIIQPSSPPVNDNLMELLLCASAVRRAAAARVTAVVPYYGYARQDRKERSRVPISAADVAKMMEAMGIDRVCCVDLHCGQIQGFFGPRTPVDNLYATPIAISYFGTRQLQNIVVV